MAQDIVNLNAEAGRDIIDDDAEPVISFTSTSETGTGVKAYASAGGTGADIDSTTGTGIDLDTTTGTGIDIDSTSGTGIDVLTAGTAGVFKSSATAGVVLNVSRSGAFGSPTIGLIKVLSSQASGAIFDFYTGLISTASYAVYKGSIPVRFNNIDKIVYLHGYAID